MGEGVAARKWVSFKEREREGGGGERGGERKTDVPKLYAYNEGEHSVYTGGS